MRERVRSWLVPPGIDLKYFILPGVIFVVVWVVFLVAIWLWYRANGDLNWSTTGSWAQVATAFSFVGGGLLAITQVAASLHRPKAQISISVNFVEIPLLGAVVDRRLFVQLENCGDDAAYGVKVSLLRARSFSATEMSVSAVLHADWTEAWRDFGQLIPTVTVSSRRQESVYDTLTYVHNGPLPPRSGLKGVATINSAERTDEIRVSCWSDNGGSARWDDPEMVIEA